MIGWLPGLALALAGADGGTTFALVIGNNRGLPDETTLQFAESDARLVARTLREIGAVPTDNIRLVVGADLEEVRGALRDLSQRLGARDELLVFLSSHGDARGAHLRGELLPWPELRAALDTNPARRVAAFVDACFSGALLTPKGFRLGAPVRLRADESARGRVVITSSGADELSFESRRVAGSPFAHFLLTGLRGAADANGDARVSMSELYAFLYGRTLAASLASDGGPQHPQQLVQLTGAGEWVLAERSAFSGRMVLDDATLGTCWILDVDETEVLAQVVATDAAVALSPGAYRVKCGGPGGMRVAEARLEVADLRLSALAFASMPVAAMIARGRQEPAVYAVSVRGGADIVGAPIFGLGAVSIERRRRGLAVEAGLTMTRQLVTGRLGVAAVLQWWDVDSWRLLVGLLLGAGAGIGGHVDTHLIVGELTQLEVPVADHIDLLLRLEVVSQLHLRPARLPTAALVGGAGLRVHF